MHRQAVYSIHNFFFYGHFIPCELQIKVLDFFYCFPNLDAKASSQESRLKFRFFLFSKFRCIGKQSTVHIHTWIHMHTRMHAHFFFFFNGHFRPSELQIKV